MRRFSIILGSLAALFAVLLPAATAQAATIPPRITWSGITVEPTSSTTCDIAPQTVTFTVTDVSGKPDAAWTVTAYGEAGSKVVFTLRLGAVTRADNGTTESVSINSTTSVTAGTAGQITFFVKLADPSGKAVDTVLRPTQDC